MKDIKLKKYYKSLIITLMILVLSALIMTITFVFSSANLNIELFSSYYKSLELIVLNILPIIIFMTLIYVLSNKMWVSFLASNILFVTASIVNKFKLTYRDDPFNFIDIKLFNESLAMTKRYEIKFTSNIILILIGLVLVTVLLKKFFKHKIRLRKTRISIFLVILLVSVISFKDVYLNEARYAKLGDQTLINIWSEPQQFQSKGFIYPFLYSMNEATEIELEGYDEEKAKKDLDKYNYADIADDEKVNVVGIMLEAYNDFSKFDTIDIDPEVYENFHKIQEDSVHGKLVTNVFAGGTINTERGFLTGYHNHPKYLTETESFARYFKEQGYTTKAMHPLYGWFYNRRNIDERLGFDSFDYYENKYEKEQEAFLDDMDFFDYITEDYEKSRDKSEPYFNFSVTYQNHGPYENTKLYDKEYLKRKPEYNESDYNIINNYLHGISETDKAIKKLTDYFENEKEPVVVVLFGDHNPWLGEDSTGYDMMDINMDFSTEEGFLNYYQTPYVIWGNQAAKDKLNKTFKEEKEDISPNFLMLQMFEYLGWQGDEYMQYTTQLKKTIDVNHKVFFKENGKYTQELSPKGKEIYQNFRNVEYYTSIKSQVKEATTKP